MNWVRENTFLASLAAILVVGVAVLGYLLLSHSGKYSEVHASYEEQTRELTRLERLALYPNQENLKRYKAERDKYAEAVKSLQAELRAMETKIEPMEPNQFQDKLRATVSAILAAAKEKNVEHPDKFYLGFDKYEAQPPPREAIPLLTRQLDAIEFLVKALIAENVQRIESLNRAPVPQETGAAAKPTPVKKGMRPDAKPETPLVEKYPIDIKFTGDQSRVRAFLNQVANTPKPFFIIRLLEVTNTELKAPTREAPAPADPQPKPPGGETPTKFIVGLEKLNVGLRIELVNFAAPAAPAVK